MAETTTPAAKVTVKTQAALVSPWAVTKTGLRADIETFVKGFKPDGGHDAAQLENVRAYALAEIAALPADTQAVEVQIETQIGPASRQARVMVTKKF